MIDWSTRESLFQSPFRPAIAAIPWGFTVSAAFITDGRRMAAVMGWTIHLWDTETWATIAKMNHVYFIATIW